MKRCLGMSVDSFVGRICHVCFVGVRQERGACLLACLEVSALNAEVDWLIASFHSRTSVPDCPTIRKDI
eukprot:3210323-Amphidinium_carterae.1